MVVGLAYTGLGLAALNAHGFWHGTLPVLAVLEAGLLALFIVGVLYLRGVPARWPQTLTATYLGGSFLAFISLIDGLVMGAAITLIDLGLSLWSLAFLAAMLRGATDLRWPGAVLLAVTYQLAIWVLLPWPHVEPETTAAGLQAVLNTGQV